MTSLLGRPDHISMALVCAIIFFEMDDIGFSWRLPPLPGRLLKRPRAPHPRTGFTFVSVISTP